MHERNRFTSNLIPNLQTIVVISAGDRSFVKFNCARHGILKVNGKRWFSKNLDLSDRMRVTPIAFSLPMLNILSTPLATLRSILRSRAALELENLALRHQIGVLRRSARRRATLTQLNRLFWAWLSRIWSDWRSALTTVQPESVRAGIAEALICSGPGRLGGASQEGPRLPTKSAS